jgi:hypothetical protein
VQFIDHEADDLVVMVGYHADAIASPQATDELVFRPGKLEALAFYFENFSHIAPDHPADVQTSFLLRIRTHAGHPSLSAGAEPIAVGVQAVRIADFNDVRGVPRVT